MVSALPGNLSGHFASRQPKTCLSLSYLAVLKSVSRFQPQYLFFAVATQFLTGKQIFCSDRSFIAISNRVAPGCMPSLSIGAFEAGSFPCGLRKTRNNRVFGGRKNQFARPLATRYFSHCSRVKGRLSRLLICNWSIVSSSLLSSIRSPLGCSPTLPIA